MKVPDKDFKDIPEMKKLIPVIDDLNKIIEKITTLYRSHKHRETHFNEASMSVEKKFLRLEFVRCTKGVSKSQGKLPQSIKIETNPENIKKLNEQFITTYLIWKKEYLKDSS